MAQWQIANESVIGPNAVAYEEPKVIGLRMDKYPTRQGIIAMNWNYQVIPPEAMAQLQALYQAHKGTQVLVEWFSDYEGWQTGYWVMAEPNIGKRSGFQYYNVSIRFTPGYRVGTPNLVVFTTAGATGMDRFRSNIIADEGRPLSIVQGTARMSTGNLPNRILADDVQATITEGTATIS